MVGLGGLTTTVSQWRGPESHSCSAHRAQCLSSWRPRNFLGSHWSSVHTKAQSKFVTLNKRNTAVTARQLLGRVHQWGKKQKDGIKTLSSSTSILSCHRKVQPLPGWVFRFWICESERGKVPENQKGPLRGEITSNRTLPYDQIPVISIYALCKT